MAGFLAQAVRGGLRAGRALAPRVAQRAQKPPQVAVRGLAAKGETEDVVAQAFAGQQQQLRAFLEASEGVKFPLGATDPGTVKAYAGKLEELKKKAGIPEFGERLEDLFAAELDVASGDVRAFLDATAGGAGAEAAGALYAALDKVEAKLGAALTTGNKEGMAAFLKEIDALGKLDEKKVAEAVKLQEAADIINAVSAGVADDVNKAKAKDNLESVDIDLKTVA